MSDLGDMKVRVTGDIQDLKNKLNDGGVIVDKFAKKTVLGSNSAAFALQNVGRVAQDVPFGFIGIQNNLNPLLESFQRLKAETGSTGGALKALGSSLMGAGGLGFALSIASAAFLIFQNGIQSFARSSASAKSGVDQLSESFAEFNNVIADSKLAIEDFNRTVEFLDKLADINLRVNVGDDFSRNITRLHQQVLSSLDELALLDDQTGKLFENSNKAYDRFLNNASSNAKKLAATTGDLTRIPEELIEGLSQADQRLIKNAKKATEEYLKTQQDRDKALQKRVILVRELDAVKEESSRKEIETLKKTAEAEAKRLANLPTIQKELALLGKELAFLNTKELAFKTDETKAKVSAIQHTIETLFKKFGLQADNPLVIDLILKAKGIQDFFEDINKIQVQALQLKDISIQLVNPDIDFRSVFEKLDGATGEQLRAAGVAAAEKFKEGFSQSLLDQQNAIFENFGLLGIEKIGEIFASFATGGDTIKSAFQGMLSLVGDFLISLGKAAVKASAVGVALQKVLAFPLAGLAAGLAAIVVGNIIKNTVKGLATGGSNLQGGFYDVGERGRERVYLPQGSSVIPNHQIQGSTGGAMDHYFHGEIQGDKLLLIHDRAVMRRGRNS